MDSFPGQPRSRSRDFVLVTRFRESCSDVAVVNFLSRQPTCCSIAVLSTTVLNMTIQSDNPPYKWSSSDVVRSRHCRHNKLPQCSLHLQSDQCSAAEQMNNIPDHGGSIRSQLTIPQAPIAHSMTITNNKPLSFVQLAIEFNSQLLAYQLVSVQLM